MSMLPADFSLSDDDIERLFAQLAPGEKPKANELAQPNDTEKTARNMEDKQLPRSSDPAVWRDLHDLSIELNGLFRQHIVNNGGAERYHTSSDKRVNQILQALFSAIGEFHEITHLLAGFDEPDSQEHP